MSDDDASTRPDDESPSDTALSRVAQDAMGSSISAVARAALGSSALTHDARAASTLHGAIEANQFARTTEAARIIGTLNNVVATSHASEAARISSTLTGALAAARFTLGNIDFGGYDASAAARAAAGVSSVLDVVRFTVAGSKAADALRFVSGDTSVVSPLVDAAHAAGRLHFGRLVHDLQLPDPAQFDPPNWPVDLDLDTVTKILNVDGIPLVWVPRREIVELLVAAPDRSSRIAILMDRVDDLVEDCRRVLAEIDDRTLVEQLPLAKDAVEAFAAGHQTSAHALATLVTETVVMRAVSGTYKVVAKKVVFDPEAVAWDRLRLAASLAPIGPFFTTWFPKQGTPAPEGLSRHVSVHQAATPHYSPGNAVVAMLLATSVLRGVQELQGDAFTEAA